MIRTPLSLDPYLSLPSLFVKNTRRLTISQPSPGPAHSFPAPVPFTAFKEPAAPSSYESSDGCADVRFYDSIWVQGRKGEYTAGHRLVSSACQTIRRGEACMLILLSRHISIPTAGGSYPRYPTEVCINLDGLWCSGDRMRGWPW